MSIIQTLPNTKYYNRCGVYKRYDDFFKSRAERDGFTRVCKCCSKEKRREYHARHRDRMNARIKEYRRTTNGKLVTVLNHVRTKCKKFDIPFALDIIDLVFPTHCPVLGLELNFDCTSPNCATIDRIRPELGYVRGNVVIVSMWANRIKSDASTAEIFKVAEFYKQFGV